MRAKPCLDDVLTIDDVMADLEHGRGPVAEDAAGASLDLTSWPRPTLGGRAFRRTYAAATVLGRIHPRLARRALLRLWFTTWVHPAATQPVCDVPDGLAPWWLPTDDGVLRGYAGGHGPTVVLIHGWSGRAADWRHLAADLVPAGWRVVVPDLPGHGMTPGESTDLFELGRATAAVLAAERPVAVVVHSMGFPAAMLALEEGAPAPDHLVALAPGRRMAHAFDAFLERARLGRRLGDELRRGIEARFGADIWDVLDVDRTLGGLTPTGLVIHDAEDDEVPLADARHIAGHWRGAELAVTTGLGHRRILRDAAVRRRIVESLATRQGRTTSIGSMSSAGSNPSTSP